MKVFVGIDIGGTNTVLGIFSAEGELLETVTIPTQLYPTFDQFMDQLYHEIRSRTNKDSLQAIGIGAPSASAFSGCIEHAPNLPWKGILPIRQGFTERMGIPVKVDNDANAAAWAEKCFGLARNLDHFATLTLGTGLGCGMVINGSIYQGQSGLAGELGHVVVEPGGRLCGCGLSGCLETYASARGLVRTWDEMGGEPNLQAYDISMRAGNNDPLAIRCFDEMGEMLARGLGIYINICNPQAIFFSGGLALSGDVFIRPIYTYLDQYVLPHLRHSFTLSLSGIPPKDTGVYGAVSLVWKK